MKIALSQNNYHVGNIDYNTDKIINKINEARNNNVDLIVFSELAICGYPPKDLLEYDYFIQRIEESIDKIVKASQNIAIIIGAPTKNKKNLGKKLFNSALFIENKRIKHVVNKTLLPTYDIFDEYRYFEPNDEFIIIDYKGEKLALTICEDVWNIENKLYAKEPLIELSNLKPSLIVNISASPYDYRHIENRKNVLSSNAKKYNLPIVYVNQIGANTDLIFDGGSLVVNRNGDICNELKHFEEDYIIIETNNINKEKNNSIERRIIKDIHDALVLGIRDYFQKCGFKKAILGLSGGIDSALTVVLAVKALGKENVHGLLLPSEFSTEHSIADAVESAKRLGISYDIINIKDIFKSCNDALSPFFKDLPFNIAEENLQARARAILLMAYSNKFGHVLLNTSNKSEAAVGYGTLYGDMCGGISVLGDVYKTQVYQLSNYINEEEEIIPVNSIVKAPSAELRPNQKDSDSLPEYEILDSILYFYIEEKMSVQDIINQGYEKEVIEKVLRLVVMNEYKRHQTAPNLRISSKSFGNGRRMPIVAKHPF